jgi:hypothetical protein
MATSGFDVFHPESRPSPSHQKPNFVPSPSPNARAPHLLAILSGSG